MARKVKHLSTVWETWVRSLGWEDSLEKEMATHSSTLALKIPWTEKHGAGYCLWGCRVRHNWATSFSLSLAWFAIFQPWIYTGTTNAEAEAPILWPPEVKSWLSGADPDAGKDGVQEKGTTEDEMVGWYHWLDGLEFEQALGDSEGQGSLAGCNRWSHTIRPDWVTNNNSDT